LSDYLITYRIKIICAKNYQNLMIFVQVTLDNERENILKEGIREFASTA